jgi:hypothetical protein
MRRDGFLAFRDFPDFETRIRPRLEAAWDYVAERIWSEQSVESLEDFRFGARCIRDLVRARRVLGGEDDGSELESLPPGSSWIDRQMWIAHGETDEDRLRVQEARFAIESSANPPLEQFQPRLRVGPPAPPHLPEIAFASPSLYAACCAEFYNHIINGTRYRVCANETCGQLFAHQAGRALKKRHRSHGVMYCDRHCAAAQVQRMHRRRRAAGRALAKQQTP